MRFFACLASLFLACSSATAQTARWSWASLVGSINDDQLIAEGPSGQLYSRDFQTILEYDNYIPCSLPMWNASIGIFNVSESGWKPYTPLMPSDQGYGLIGRFTFQDDVSGESNFTDYIARVSLTEENGQLNPHITFDDPAAQRILWTLGDLTFDGNIETYRYSNPPNEGFEMNFSMRYRDGYDPGSPTDWSNDPEPIPPGLPEPGTFIIGCIGLLGIGLKRRFFNSGRRESTAF